MNLIKHKFQLLLLAFITSLFLFSSAGVVSAETVHGIKQRPSQVQDIKITNKVDRDGDGKISDFDIEMKVSSETFKFPSKAARTIMSGSSKAFGAISGIPTGWITSLTYKATMAPQFCVTAGSDDQDGPIPVMDYWMPSNKNSVITKNIRVSDHNFSKEGKDSLAKLIESEKVKSINGIAVTTHYKAIEEKGIKTTGKVTVKNPPEEMKRAMEHPCGISDLKYLHIIQPGNEIQLESPSQDKEGRVRFTSKFDGVEIFIDGNSIGKTPMVHSFPADIGEVELKAKKDGYKTKVKKVKLNPTDDAKQVVDLELQRIEKPIVIKSTPSGASITVNDGVTTLKTPHTLQTWIKSSPTITVSNDQGTKTFENVEPPATINANLQEQNQIDYSNINSELISPNISDRILNNNIQFPDIDYSNIIPPSLVVMPVKAEFNASPTSTKTGSEVEFDATPSYSLLSKVQDYSWDFGDGNTARGEKTTHIYKKSGSYDVKLTIIDDNGKSASVEQNITVDNRRPKAKFKASSYSISPGDSIYFNATSSTDPEDSISSFSWDFGNGDRAQGEKTAYSYSAPGEYKVELTVADNKGAVDIISRKIEVKPENKLPEAKVKLSQEKIGVNQEIKFDASGSSDSDGAIDSYDWLIDGNKYLGGKTVTHTFSSTGTKTIELSVTDFNSGRATASTTVEVVKEKVDIKTLDEKEGKEQGSEEGVFAKIINWFQSIFSQLF